MPYPTITVALCTWNRADSLARALAALEAMNVPQGLDWRLVAVNNNCTDDTQTVLSSFADRLPLTVLQEPRQGIAHARNRAVAAAAGDYILWTDDDVVVARDWLAAYAEAFRQWPGAAVFGGPITPQQEGTPPAWLRRAIKAGIVDTAFANRDLGPEPIALDDSDQKIPFGANFALRLADQRAHPYNPRYGLVGDDRVLGEETDVMRRVLAGGREARWVPGASVDHMISVERQTTDYLESYFRGLGRTIARAGADREAPSRLGAARLWMAAVALQMRYTAGRITAPPETWCHYLKSAAMTWSQWYEIRAILRARPTTQRAEQTSAAYGQSPRDIS